MKTNTLLSLCAMAMLSLSAAGSEVDASISINDKMQFQHVTGFGGFSPSPTWSYWLNNAQMEKLYGKGDDQLGLTVLRLYMANSKGPWSSGVANAKIAKKHGAFIFASPWSPPGAWKTNGSDSNGGELLESRYSDWANFLNDYYKYMQKQGVEIDAVSIQNEPDWNASYQSCIWTGEKMAKFLRENGSQIECKIIAPEAIHFSRNMHEPILNDDEACARLDIVGGHFYGWDGSAIPLAAQKGKEVWMTEYLINERQQNQGLDINWKDDGFLFANSINDAMLANMSAWVHYSLKRYYGCLGDGTYGTVDNEITKRGYILSHYAKYVSNTTRIRHAVQDPENKLTASAYRTVSGDSIVLMVLNPSDNMYNLQVTLPFNVAGYTEIETTEYANMSKSEEEEDESYTPTVYISPWSVTTYVFKKSSEREDMNPGDEDGEVVFADNFDLYGASCVPEGWRARYEDGFRNPGEYTLGPRIMAFSLSGVMTHAFYFRTGTKNKGMICYGQLSEPRLPLSPGKYSISYSTVGWKSTPTVTFSVQKVGGRTLFKEDVEPEYVVEECGPGVRITDTTDATVGFEIEEDGNYILKWDIPAATEGLNEVLVGNIRLVRHDDQGGVENVAVDNESAGWYDIMGRAVKQPTAPGLYISGGKKYIVK